MTFRIYAAIAMVALLAACGSDGGDAETAEQDSPAAECVQIADDGVAGINEMLAQYEGKSLEDLAEDIGAGVPPDLEQRMEELDERAEASGCAGDELDELLAARADEIEGEGFVADLLRAAFREGASE